METKKFLSEITKNLLAGASLIRHYKKTLNNKEFATWFASEEGLAAQVDAVSWDIKRVPEVWQKYSRIIQDRRDSVYQQCLVLAADYEDTVEAITAKAERLCIDRWVYPPHWTTSIYCDNCGEVLAPNDSVGCYICLFAKEISNALGQSEASLRATIQEGDPDTQEIKLPAVSGHEPGCGCADGERPKRMGVLPSMERKDGGR